MYIHTFSTWSRILDFGKGFANETVALTLTKNTTGIFNQMFWDGSSLQFTQESTTKSTLSTWIHVAFVVTNQNAYIYLNGLLDAATIITGQPSNVLRNFNYIGKSSDPLNDLANVIIDELKIFNRGLNESEIQYDYSNQMFSPKASPSCNPNSNYLNVSGLVNYWTFCSSLNDVIGQATLFGANNATLVSDRFGQPSSALNLQFGFVQAPTGVYFTGDCTVTAWVFILF